MDIVIVGAGVVGANLARQLAGEGQDVALIDTDAARLEDAAATIDCLTVLGSGASPSILRKAGIERADLVIAVTSEDTINTVVCVLAWRFGVKYKVARIRNPEYRDLNSLPALIDAQDSAAADKVGAERTALSGIVDTIVNPDEIIVSTLTQFINSPGAVEAADFADGRVQLRKFQVLEGSKLDGMALLELGAFTKVEPFLIVAIDRGDTTIVPTGEDVVRAGDLVTVVMPDGVQPFVLPLMGHSIAELEKVVIAGTTPAAIRLSQQLEGEVGQVILIEEDQQRSEAAAEEVGRARVFYGKTTDDALLDEVGLDTADFFIALTDSDEHNLLSCLLAKRKGAKRVAMLVHETEYLSVLESIGIDIAINARLLTMGAILRYVRRGRILSIAKFQGDRAEAIELIVEPKARICGKPLKELHLPRGAILGAVHRGDDVFLPNGESVIEPGDRVIVFSLTSAIPDVEKLFSPKRLFG